MDNTRNIYRKITLLMVAMLFIVISSTYIYFVVNIGKTYEEHAVENIVEVKKEFLKSIVDNLILEIEIIQSQEKEYYEEWIDNTAKILREYYDRSSDHFIDLFIIFCKMDMNKDILSVSIKDTKLDTILYESGVDRVNGLEKENFSSYFQETYDDYEVFIGVSHHFVDKNVKEIVANRIRSKEFAQNSYIWVNEIKDYSGGEDYAIRLIHPNLKDTEGQFLSTNTKDVMGNYPYAQELEGIKKDGELFFNYHFKKKDSNIISEKITYAKLYKKYDWVIAIGAHFDDIESYIDITTKDKNQIVTKTIKNIIAFMVVVFILYWLLISQVERWYYRKYNNNLKEVFTDPLTKIQNRRSATMYLESAFTEFKKTGQTPMIMMIDIDDFKQVNDMYGHFEGDRVLKNVVGVIQKNIRDTDTLYRWGGEEFLLICNGLKEEDVIGFANKIISIVGKKEYEYDGEKYYATISMGIDQFDKLDITYEDSLKRADAAMYNAKSKGKNRACTWEICGINPVED